MERAECRQLNDVGFMDDADGDVVVEVDRARVAGRDLVRLEARLREDQHLRIDPDVEVVQQARQVAEPVVVVERGGSRGDRLSESGDRVLEWAGVVLDRRVVGWQISPVRLVALGCRTGHERRHAERHATHPRQESRSHGSPILATEPEIGEALLLLLPSAF